MSDLPSWIQANATGIQAAAAIVLAVVITWTLIVLRRYAADTATIARASLEQLKASFEQVKASTAQVEALHAPCLTIQAMQRDRADAVLDVDARTDMVLLPLEGLVAIQNFGTGPAMNIEYAFTPLAQENRVRANGYIPYLALNKSFGTKMPWNAMREQEYVITIECESVSGQKYQTSMTSSNCALSDFKFTKKE